MPTELVALHWYCPALALVTPLIKRFEELAPVLMPNMGPAAISLPSASQVMVGVGVPENEQERKTDWPSSTAWSVGCEVKVGAVPPVEINDEVTLRNHHEY